MLSWQWPRPSGDPCVCVSVWVLMNACCLSVWFKTRTRSPRQGSLSEGLQGDTHAHTYTHSVWAQVDCEASHLDPPTSITGKMWFCMDISGWSFEHLVSMVTSRGPLQRHVKNARARAEGSLQWWRKLFSCSSSLFMSVWFFRRTGSEVMAARRRTALSSVLVAALLLVMLLPGESNSMFVTFRPLGRKRACWPSHPLLANMKFTSRKTREKNDLYMLQCRLV